MSNIAIRGIGSPLPDVDLLTIDGRRIGLASLTGKRRLLFMWASW